MGIDKNTVLVRYLYSDAYSVLYSIQWESGKGTGPKLNIRNASQSVKKMVDGTFLLSHGIKVPQSTEYV